MPEAQRDVLSAYLTECSVVAPAFRWTSAANLHVTLRFLGQVEMARAEALAGGLSDRDLRGVDMELGELGTFKRGRLVRVVWLGLRTGAEEARALAAEVDAQCAATGLAPEQRTFQPHLTLGRSRARDGAVLPTLQSPPVLPPWRADELVLYRSRLGRAGSVYEPLLKLRLS